MLASEGRSTSMPAFSSAAVTDGGFVQASSLTSGHFPESVTIDFKSKPMQHKAEFERYCHE